MNGQQQQGLAEVCLGSITEPLQTVMHDVRAEGECEMRRSQQQQLCRQGSAQRTWQKSWKLLMGPWVDSAVNSGTVSPRHTIAHDVWREAAGAGAAGRQLEGGLVAKATTPFPCCVSGLAQGSCRQWAGQPWPYLWSLCEQCFEQETMRWR